MTPWNPTVFGKNIREECREMISEFQKSGQKILCVAFPPAGGNQWSVITDQTFFNRNIPDECHQKMMEFQKAGHTVIWVAFPPAGGNRWSVITHKGAFFNRGIPDECHEKMLAFQKAGARPISVSFPPAGGNRWSVITHKGTFFNRGIPDECHTKMGSFGEKVVSVTFPFPGGNRYVIIGENGKFFCRNTPGGCHRVMRAMNNSGVGALAMVGFHPSGAYAIVSDVDPAGKTHPVLSIGGKTFSLDSFSANLKVQLDDSTICKYGFMVRYKSAMRAWASGPKRTAANPPEQPFTVFDWFNPASVTKTVTAVALLHVLSKKGLTIEEKIHKWLPKAWNIPQSIKTISVKELLNHTSGIRLKGLTYSELQTLVEAGIMMEDKEVALYNNANYALARIVTAYLAGHKTSDADQGAVTAQKFIAYCQANIFDPLGIPDVEWKPDADEPTEFYPQPPGNSGGTSYGDWSLRPGSAGVHLSLAELSIFVDKLATTNILLPQAVRTQMDSEGLGLGKHGSGKGEYYSKGGYFPGSMNGGAELHSAIYKYTNGVQLAIVYNGEGDKSKVDVGKAYEEAWK